MLLKRRTQVSKINYPTKASGESGQGSQVSALLPRIDRIAPETNRPHCYFDCVLPGRKNKDFRFVIRVRPDKAPAMSGLAIGNLNFITSRAGQVLIRELLLLCGGVVSLLLFTQNNHIISFSFLADHFFRKCLSFFEFLSFFFYFLIFMFHF